MLLDELCTDSHNLGHCKEQFDAGSFDPGLVMTMIMVMLMMVMMMVMRRFMDMLMTMMRMV